MRLFQKILFLCFILPLGLEQDILAQSTEIKGNLVDESSGEPLGFASIIIEGTKLGTTSDENGKFELNFNPKRVKGDSATVKITFLGFGVISKTFPKTENQQFDLALSPTEQQLKIVEVSETKNVEQKELESTQMSAITVPIKQIMRLPSIGGEVDIVRVMQLLPGVSGGVEGTTGMFVRGGTDDQNLVLLDKAPVYEFSHLFGFFSIFNPNAVENFTLYKGAFPAKHGGRLSSILDIEKKQGNETKIHGAGGVGLLSSRLTLEGPIIKNKLSFVVSARRTYIDQVAKIVNQNIPYYFYDLSGQLTYKINENNTLYLSSYFGKDVLYVDENTTGGRGGGPEEGDNGNFSFTKQNLASSLRWNRKYNAKLSSDVTLINTFFNYNIKGGFRENSIEAKSKIVDIGARMDFNYELNELSHVEFGGEATQHQFRPNLVTTSGDISEFLGSSEGPQLNFQEIGMYGSYHIKLIDSKLALNTGLRVSAATPERTFYSGLEPRFSSRYSLTSSDVVKGSYSRMNQYMHRVSSSTATLPTDMWYPVTSNIKPQKSDQIAVGYEHLFTKPRIKISLEGYYKWMNNLIEYREGTNLILNNDFEDDLLQGKGRAYGTEFLVRRDVGRFNGWVAYTLSWTNRQFDGLNQDKQYFAKYDRRHDLSIVANFEINKRLDFSAIWVYMSGSRFTPQIGQYVVANPSFTGAYVVPIYSDRNAVKMSDTHRLDLNLVIKPKEKPNRKFYGEWHIGCYNTYNRASPYQIQVVPSDNGIGYQYEQEGLFGFLPSFSYNFKF